MLNIRLKCKPNFPFFIFFAKSGKMRLDNKLMTENQSQGCSLELPCMSLTKLIIGYSGVFLVIKPL